jgi:hypothetical protein
MGLKNKQHLLNQHAVYPKLLSHRSYELEVVSIRICQSRNPAFSHLIWLADNRSTDGFDPIELLLE